MYLYVDCIAERGGGGLDSSALKQPRRMDTIRIGAARGCCERMGIQGPNRGRV